MGTSMVQMRSNKVFAPCRFLVLPLPFGCSNLRFGLAYLLRLSMHVFFQLQFIISDWATIEGHLMLLAVTAMSVAPKV